MVEFAQCAAVGRSQKLGRWAGFVPGTTGGDL